MRYLLMLSAMVLGAGLAWFGYEPTDHTGLTHEKDKLLDEIELLEQSIVLPDAHESWHLIKSYITLYEDLSLLPLDDDFADSLPFKTQGWGGVLSGDARQLFSASRGIQNIAPVYFDRFSLDSETEKANAKLTLYVLGATK